MSFVARYQSRYRAFLRVQDAHSRVWNYVGFADRARREESDKSDSFLCNRLRMHTHNVTLMHKMK